MVGGDVIHRYELHVAFADGRIGQFGGMEGNVDDGRRRRTAMSSRDGRHGRLLGGSACPVRAAPAKARPPRVQIGLRTLSLQQSSWPRPPAAAGPRELVRRPVFQRSNGTTE